MMNTNTLTTALVAAGLLFSSLSASAGLTAEEVQTLLRDAKGFSGTGRYDLARLRCEQAIKLDPNNREAHSRLEQVIRQAAVQRKEREAETHVIRPTYPPQHLHPVPRLPLFK